MTDKVIKFIKGKFEEKLKKNKQYSMRAFARDLSIEHSSLSKILGGKRPLTFETADKILSALDVQVAIKNALLLSMANSTNYVEKFEDEDYITLSEAELSDTYRWYFYGILCALEIKDVDPSVEGIALHLNLDIETVNFSIKILNKLGAVKTTENGKFILTGKHFTTSNNVKSESLKKAHLDHIEQALDYLKTTAELSDFTGVTFAIPITKLEEAIRRIKEFRRSLAAWLSQDDLTKTDVYRLNIQLFPLGRNKDR